MRCRRNNIRGKHMVHMPARPLLHLPPHAPCRASNCRGDGIFVRLERGDLAASVDFGKNVRPGESVALTDGGSLMMFASKPGASRRVDIVKPGVEIRVLQPWVSGPTGGSYAQRCALAL